MSPKRLFQGLVLVFTLVYNLACTGILTGFSGPPIGEVAVQAGTPFELEVASTGAASEVWIVYRFHYEDTEPEVRVSVTATSPEIGTMRAREVFPGGDVTVGTGTRGQSRALIELPSVEKGETIRIRGVVRPGPGNHLDSARLVVVES